METCFHASPLSVQVIQISKHPKGQMVRLHS
uniref:Uncharacterized protein n=1 Tax=Arundo donax TaxID=35708 RepID=A0A0A9BB80_ARUDO